MTKTHPLIEAAERAFLAGVREIHDRSGDALATDERARDAVLAVLREMSNPELIHATILLQESPTSITINKVIQGYINAIIKEIEQ